MPAEKRENRAGTNRQNGPRDRGDRVSHELVRLGPEIPDDGFFLDEDGNRPGDKERRDETEQNMHPGVFLEHHECFIDGVLDGGAAERDEIGGQEYGQENGEYFQFFH